MTYWSIGRSDAEINELIEGLKRDETALHRKGIAEGYLGVDIQQERNQITLLQEDLKSESLLPLVWTQNMLLLSILLLMRLHSAGMLTAKKPAGASITPV
jgi:hypothetical protein